jgi:ketosteroid isomerase-like protein
MSEEAVMQRVLEAWNGGVETFLERLAPDVEWHAPRGFPEGEYWRGRDAVAPVLREQFASVFTGARLEPTEVVRGPGGWLVAGRSSASHGDDVTLEWASHVVVQLEGEFVKQVWVFADREGAVRQAGLDE